MVSFESRHARTTCSHVERVCNAGLNGQPMSLLGVFVTVSGIVVGADTATKPRGTSDFVVSSDAKFTVCGTRAYAGLTGSSSVIIESDTSSTQYFALDAVRKACEELTKQTDLPVRTLTELIGKALGRYVESTYPKQFRSCGPQKVIRRSSTDRKPIPTVAHDIIATRVSNGARSPR
jgi:hypothetical protein